MRLVMVNRVWLVMVNKVYMVMYHNLPSHLELVKDLPSLLQSIQDHLYHLANRMDQSV